MEADAKDEEPLITVNVEDAEVEYPDWVEEVIENFSTPRGVLKLNLIPVEKDGRYSDRAMRSQAWEKGAYLGLVHAQAIRAQHSPNDSGILCGEDVIGKQGKNIVFPGTFVKGKHRGPCVPSMSWNGFCWATVWWDVNEVFPVNWDYFFQCVSRQDQ